MDELESPSIDEMSRFAALYDESLKLLGTARSLVGEMRTALEKCKRHRPAVETPTTAPVAQPARPAVRTHRGGRVTKKRRQRRIRRPR